MPENQENRRGQSTRSIDRIVIVGGVAGGATAAARARRLSERTEITVVERGDHVSFANCGLPYHIGGMIQERETLLLQTPAGFRSRYAINVRVRTEAVRLDRKTKQLVVRDVASGVQETIGYDVLLLSPGAEPVRPPIPGAGSRRAFTLRSMADMDAIKSVVDGEKPPRAVIIGGGYIGLEMTEALRERNVEVTIVELSDQVMGTIDPEMASLLRGELSAHGVDLRLSTTVVSIDEGDSGLSVRLATGEDVACGMVIFAIGVRPEVKLAREAGLTIGSRGGIVVDDQMRTSDPDIFAVGDAVEVQDLVSQTRTIVPLAGPANRQARIAADAIFGRPARYGQTQGTAICKLFNVAVGMTGLSEKMAVRLGVPCEKVYIHPSSHADYYPGASAIHLKLLFDPTSGKVLGAQAVGADGVDKRIDVLAVAIRAGMTVFDLEELELAYAPPYGSAKDPVNVAGFVAANVLRGDVKLAHVCDLKALKPDQVLLDVRTTAEVAAGTIPGSINIPLDELRSRIQDLDAGKEHVVFCRVGLRGYLACRILSQHGIRCRNLSGGYITYRMVTGSSGSKPKDTTSKEAMGRVTGEKVVSSPVTQCSCPASGSAPGTGTPPLPRSSAGTVPIVKVVDACGL